MSIGGAWLLIILVVLLYRSLRWLAEPDRSDEYRRHIEF